MPMKGRVRIADLQEGTTAAVLGTVVSGILVKQVKNLPDHYRSCGRSKRESLPYMV